MFNSVSMAGTGGVVLIVEELLKLFGFEFGDGAVAQAVDAVWTLVGFGMLIWGQVRRPDLIGGLVRR